MKDFNGNVGKGNDGQDMEFMFLVEEQPDLVSPAFDISVDGQPVTSGEVFNESPEFLITVTDDHALDESTLVLSFGSADEPLAPVATSKYTMSISDDSRKAEITFPLDLMNGEYAIQMEAADTTGNHSALNQSGPFRFRVDEEVRLGNVVNAPNPFARTTVFSYSLNQPADKIVVKIYNLKGRLLRTLEQDAPTWHYSEEFWDGRDENGNKLASGVYFYRFIVYAGKKKIIRTGKLAIIR